MIPFLTEMPAGPGIPPLTPAGAGEGGGSRLDFAGLLGAALPPVNGAAMVTAAPGAAMPDDAALACAEVHTPALALPTPLLPPAGRSLPQPGADLPEPVAAPLPLSFMPRTFDPRAPAPAMLSRGLVAEGDPAPTRADVSPEPAAQMPAARAPLSTPPFSAALTLAP